MHTITHYAGTDTLTYLAIYTQEHPEYCGWGTSLLHQSDRVETADKNESYMLGGGGGVQYINDTDTGFIHVHWQNYTQNSVLKPMGFLHYLLYQLGIDFFCIAKSQVTIGMYNNAVEFVHDQNWTKISSCN